MDQYTGVVGSLGNMLPLNYDLNTVIQILLINNIKIAKGSNAEKKINEYLTGLK